jgi:hypothetical protein
MENVELNLRVRRFGATQSLLAKRDEFPNLMITGVDVNDLRAFSGRRSPAVGAASKDRRLGQTHST